MIKVIALLACRNEEKFIPSYLSSVTKIADQIIAIDDKSNDNTAKLLRDAGATVIASGTEEMPGWAEYDIRQKLLELGRAAGGTHFIVLDADETFTGNFVTIAKPLISKLTPGQRIQMRWLTMWKSVDHYKEDETVWTNNFKDFIFCDDGTSNYKKIWLHTPRTPGEYSSKENSLVLNTKYGSVIHFSFSDWVGTQVKQSWCRCSELLKGFKNSDEINYHYAISMDHDSIVEPLPESWKVGVVFPKISYQDDINNLWRFKQIEKWFKQYGPEHFSKLQIWYLPQIVELGKKVSEELLTEKKKVNEKK